MSIKSAVAGTLLMVLPGLAATAAEVDFDDWDITGEGYISLMEWDTALGARTIFDKLDENGNGAFDFAESVRDPLFRYDVTADVNGDGRIVSAEFVLGSFRRLDANNDSAIDQSEFMPFAEAAADSPLFRN